jgi:ABC-type microcin C transport system duplicated ATPase subunit YejF
MVFQGAMNAFDPVRRIGQQIVEPMELHGQRAGAEAESRVHGCWRPVGHRARAREELSRTSCPAGCASGAAIAMALACSPACFSPTSRRLRST